MIGEIVAIWILAFSAGAGIGLASKLLRRHVAENEN